ncbi:hypothetical protein [Methylobacter psychrophilus]|uniref:hypothetical protein n=1 Tax=Methylobacter psychrophilus TaxID=96941 RepID=UPI0021D4BC3E|nr:hypothetical protein [Methylobacter psychrophilus]
MALRESISMAMATKTIPHKEIISITIDTKTAIPKEAINMTIDTKTIEMGMSVGMIINRAKSPETFCYVLLIQLMQPSLGNNTIAG